MASDGRTTSLILGVGHYHENPTLLIDKPAGLAKACTLIYTRRNLPKILDNHNWEFNISNSPENEFISQVVKKACQRIATCMYVCLWAGSVRILTLVLLSPQVD